MPTLPAGNKKDRSQGGYLLADIAVASLVILIGFGSLVQGVMMVNNLTIKQEAYFLSTLQEIGEFEKSKYPTQN